MFRVRSEDRLPEQARRLLEDRSRGALFLHPRWINALARAYPRFRFRHLVLEDEKKIAGVLPLAEIPRWGWREVASLPFGTYGGPILPCGVAEEGARALIAGFLRAARSRRTSRFEMTVFGASEPMERVLLDELGAYRIPAETWLIDLERGTEALWKSYEGRARTSIRKAIKAGVTVEVDDGREAVETLYRLHAAQGESRAVPWHHSRNALHKVWEVLGQDARVWVARREGRPLCAALVLYNPGQDVHPWVTGAVPESRPANAFPYLMHRAMEDAARRGYRRWNFGPSAGSKTVSYFKASFGGTPRPLLRFFFEAGWIGRARRLRPRWGGGSGKGR